jgi:transcriptional regulator with PAS, ATPase and Fis domain
VQEEFLWNNFPVSSMLRRQGFVIEYGVLFRKGFHSMTKAIRSINQETIDILESFLDNVMIYNHDGVLVYACEKFWKDTGISPADFAGKGIADIKNLNLYQPYCAEIAWLTNEKFTTVQHAFADEITVATALPIKDKNGCTFLIVAYAENNSRIIALEKKLAEANRVLQEKNDELSLIWNRPFLTPDVSGESPEVLKVRKLIERIVDIDANVLLSGETGVGKTMFAKLIHAGSIRRNHPFIEINCAAIPKTLLESELFGYERGAFTGASEKGKKGQIQLAAKGTLFLDEISELSLDLQSKLLKAIQDKKIMRIGGTEFTEVDFRLIAASNKNLESLVQEKLFRADLYYRLNVIPIEIPALRNRKEDIHPLAKHFLDRFNEKYHQNKYFNKDAIAFLMRYDWPGNVRELENTVERLVLTVESNEIHTADIPQQMRAGVVPFIRADNGLKDALNRMESMVLTETWQRCNGNVSQIARALKLTRQSVIRRLQKYGIPASILRESADGQPYVRKRTD